MIPRRFALPAVLALTAGTVLSLSSASTYRAVPQEHEESELGQAMEGIKGDLKSLGKGIEAKDKEAAWKAVCSLQAHALAAKQQVPEKTGSVPEAQRAEFVDSFRAKISQLLKASCDAEAAVLGGKFDEADQVVKETIWPLQKPSHKEFRNK